MIEAKTVYLRKARESLAGAESEFANGRYNNCANRVYYCCFQGAIYALLKAGVGPGKAQLGWGHSYVQAQFSKLINRRKKYPASLRTTLSRALVLRQTADYEMNDAPRTETYRMLQRVREFINEILQNEGENE